MACAAVQVRADGGVAVIRQAASELLVELVPAWHVHHDHDAGERSVAFRPGDIRVNLVAVGAGVRRATRGHCRGSVRAERVPHGGRGPFEAGSS